MQPHFSSRVNKTLVELLREAERRLVKAGICETHEANQWLINEYIRICAQMHEYAQVYLPAEERCAASIFLWEIIIRLRMKTRYQHKVERCLYQLTTHTPFYLPNYLLTLEQRFMEFMAQMPSIDQISSSGLIKQAAATLPTSLVLNVAKRELHRLGYDYDRTFVPVDILNSRLSYDAFGPPNKFDSAREQTYRSHRCVA